MYLHLLLFPVAASVAVRAARFRWDNVRTVYAFGDSYTFVQGTRGHANFSFIANANDLAFTPVELLTNEIILKNTSSDGANWIEYLTGCFAGPPQTCRSQLWDFAFAGADIDDALLPRHHDFTVSLTNQVAQFLTYARGVLPPADLVAWWIGINDTGDTIGRSDIGDFDAFWERERWTRILLPSNACTTSAGRVRTYSLTSRPASALPARSGTRRAPRSTRAGSQGSTPLSHGASPSLKRKTERRREFSSSKRMPGSTTHSITRPSLASRILQASATVRTRRGSFGTIPGIRPLQFIVYSPDPSRTSCVLLESI